MQNTHQRFHSLDLLRGVMMWLGLVLHAAQMYMSTGLSIDYYLDPQQSIVMDVLLIVINTFRMPVFYALSGFFTAMLLMRYGLGGMLNNRFRRVVVPFILFLPPLALVMNGLEIAGATRLATGAWGMNPDVLGAGESRVDKTHNLWFLYYLAMFIGSAALVHWLRGQPDDRVKQPISAGLLLLFVAALALLGSTSDTGRIGPSLSFLPSPSAYAYFGLCFALGYACYLREGTLALMERHGWPAIGLAWLCLVVGGTAFALQCNASPVIAMASKLVLPIASGITVVLFIVGFIGLFQRYFDHYSPLGRYIADSSYWVFIVHSVFQVAIAIAMSNLLWPATIKFLIVLLGSTVLSLLTYDFWVRNGRIGEVLNGRRLPRGLKRIRD